jgi:predicted nucleic acid-binding protein
MRTIVFDSGPIISLTMNNLLWVLEPLKKISNAKFLITKTVKEELVDKPLNKTKRFMFEALQVLHYIENGTLEVVDSETIRKQTLKFLSVANNCFNAFGHNMNIVHEAEMSAIALYLEKGADVFVVDERTARLLVENPKRLYNIIRHTLHTDVKENKGNIREFKKITRDVSIIRSSEIVTIAYEMCLLDSYKANIPDTKRTLLESILWGVKLNGCAVSKREIEQIIRIERL